MINTLLYRILLAVPTMLGVAVICFRLVQIAPGDPLVSVMPPDASESLRQTLMQAYGFDKPEKNNATRSQPYPSLLASSQTYGHTGFTGTCFWIDPDNNLIYILLSNRVYDKRTHKELMSMGIRQRIQEEIYQAMRKSVSSPETIIINTKTDGEQTDSE